MSTHRIQISDHTPNLTLLPMGGNSPGGVEIAANQEYLTLAGSPWLPVMGEFHFSRYPRERWEEELLKMQAGGITIVATYLFWIHIEEIEGQFDWSGNRDIRAFIELCSRHGLLAYPRIGPWAHGECRNGGFPDWLLEKCGHAVREDAQPYLSYVTRYYQEIAQQLKGLLWKDGGPIVGIQIENELTHRPGHIHTLLGLARAAGLEAPIYTMTGWGPAQVPPGGEIIPVFGGYPDAFWDRQIEDWSRPSRKHYLFSYLRDDNTIGADLRQRPEAGDLSHLRQFPYGTCETGGGMQVAYHRRPIIQPDDISALATAKVGNGSNLQGYYMYHGGANPTGKRSRMQESQETHYPNDLPVINYDFQAPLGQYGQVRAVYHALRPLHLFLQDFGEVLAPLPMTLPEQTPVDLDDVQTLRWAVRSDGQQGFLFINNYQRIEPLPAHPQTQLQVCLPNETLTVPAAPLDIPAGMYAIWPLNLEINGARLKYATAQLLCRLEEAGGPLYVFFASDGVMAEFAFEDGSLGDVQGEAQVVIRDGLRCLTGMQPGPGCVLSLTAVHGGKARILLLTQGQARQFWKGRAWGRERLFLCDESLLFDANALRLHTSAQEEASVAVYPDPGLLVQEEGIPLSRASEGIFVRYAARLTPIAPHFKTHSIQPAAPPLPVKIGPFGVAQAPADAAYLTGETWQVTLEPEALKGVHEVILHVDYTGDAARAFLGDQLIDDDFYHGQPWEIGLSRFQPAVSQEPITLRFLPLRADAPIYLPPEARPDFQGQESLVEVHGLCVREVREIRIEQMTGL